MALQTIKEVRRRLQKRWDRGVYLANAAPVGSGDAFPLREPVGSVSARALHEEFETVRAVAAEYSALEARGKARRPKARAESAQPGARAEAGVAGAGAGAAGTAGLTVEWTQRNDRRIGTNSVPAALHFPTIDTLAQFLGSTPARRLATFRASAARLLKALPALHGWIAAHPIRLTELSEVLEQLIAVTEWFVHHPHPDIYIRQIPVDGIDTKFVEGHIGTLTAWWDALQPEPTEATGPAAATDQPDQAAQPDQPGRPTREAEAPRGGRRTAAFARRYGFRLPPETVRFRLLEEGPAPEGYTDLRILLAEFAAHPPDVRPPTAGYPTAHHPAAGAGSTGHGRDAHHRNGPCCVFIVENEITGLAFPPVEHGIVIFGGGYSVGALAAVGWLSDVPVYYWGDIDTHGFAILNRLRAGHPHTTSILMDQDTLETHRSRWSRESQQFTGTLPHLTADEARLFDDLKNDRLGTGVRLEQERIDYSRVIATMKSPHIPRARWPGTLQ